MVFWKGNLRRVDNHVRSAKQLFRTGIHHTKNIMNSAYNIARNIDHGVRTAKEIYGIVQPHVEQMAGLSPGQDPIRNKAMKIFSSYDNVRNRVMDSHADVEHHVGAVVSELKKKNINIGLN